jgi:hypothetical protein
MPWKLPFIRLDGSNVLSDESAYNECHTLTDTKETESVRHRIGNFLENKENRKGKCTVCNT